MGCSCATPPHLFLGMPLNKGSAYSGGRWVQSPPMQKRRRLLGVLGRCTPTHSPPPKSEFLCKGCWRVSAELDQARGEGRSPPQRPFELRRGWETPPPQRGQGCSSPALGPRSLPRGRRGSKTPWATPPAPSGSKRGGCTCPRSPLPIPPSLPAAAHLTGAVGARGSASGSLRSRLPRRPRAAPAWPASPFLKSA